MRPITGNQSIIVCIPAFPSFDALDHTCCHGNARRSLTKILTDPTWLCRLCLTIFYLFIYLLFLFLWSSSVKFLFVIIYFEISLGHILLVFDGFNNEKRATRLMEFISESLREYQVADIKTNYMSSNLLRVILILFPVF